MALHWRPVGPEPASTYWQRRAVLAIAVVLLLALLVALLTGGDDADDTLGQAAAPSAAPAGSAPAAPSPASTAEPTAAPSPTPTAVPICQPEALRVESDAEKDSYPVGGDPRLSLSVTNTGTAPCTRDLGQAAVELVVLSGSDRIWSSDDCKPGGAKDVTTLQPGKPVVQRVTWDGRRSAPGCGGSKAQAQAGTYRVVARVGQLMSDDSVFVLRD